MRQLYKALRGFAFEPQSRPPARVKRYRLAIDFRLLRVRNLSRHQPVLAGLEIGQSESAFR
jgi:hypothetical protein